MFGKRYFNHPPQARHQSCCCSIYPLKMLIWQGKQRKTQFYIKAESGAEITLSLDTIDGAEYTVHLQTIHSTFKLFREKLYCIFATRTRDTFFILRFTNQLQFSFTYTVPTVHKYIN